MSATLSSQALDVIGGKFLLGGPRNGISSSMLNDAEWTGLGGAATLLSGFVAHRLGWIQIGIMRDEHVLNVRKATPRLNTRVSIERFHPPSRPDITRYTIHTKIYNDGDLVARHLEGKWKLTASEGIIEDGKPIRVESLPAFLPWELHHEVSGNVQALWCKPQVILQVDVEFDYLGLDDKPQHYEATYDYDFQHRSMIQRK